MEQFSPAAAVPPNWVHPDLKRQVTSRRRREATARLRMLEEHNVTLNTCALETSSDLQQKRHDVAALERQLQQLRDEITCLEADETELKEALSVVVSQLADHRAGVSQLRAVAHSPHQSYEVLAGEEVTSAAEEPFTVNVEPFFAHMLWRPLSCFSPTVCEHSNVELFLRRFAPMFSWDSVSCTVRAHPTLDKPCLMETEGSPCDSPVCRYLHHDPLQHARAALLALETATTAFHTQDQRVDCVAELLCTWRTVQRRCRTPEELNSCTAQLLRRIIGHGWHSFFVSADSCVWRAPMMASSALPDDAQQEPSQSRSGRGSPLRVADLRNEAERDCWRAVLECADMHIPAAQLFVDTPDAILWRCMIRTTARTPVQRLWLARRGIDVYPGSPHLQLHYVLALIDTHASPESCLEACLQAVSTLSAQTCAASVIPGEAAVAVASTVSRYSAYLVARCALYLAKDATGEDGAPSDGARCAEELLTAVLKDDGREAALLPTATVNLTLMLISLKQVNTLAHMDGLPLGAISDQVFTLTKTARMRPQDGCTQRLNGLLGLLSAMHSDEMDPSLVAALKASVQLSLQRTFAVQLHFVEQIVRKSSVSADIVAAALWGEYVRCVGQFDSTEASTHLALELLQACDTHLPCLLTWTLIDHLAVCGDGAAHRLLPRLAAKACDGFESKHPDVVPLSSASRHNEEKFDVCTTSPDPVELAAYHLLHALTLPHTTEQAEYMAGVPLDPLLSSSDALVLLLMAQLKLCAVSVDVASFRQVLRKHLCRLLETHLLWWSPLDVWFTDVVGVPHMVSLLVYRAVPALLGSHSESTMAFREAVLDVAADVGVLHPLLCHGE